jgi:kynurenine formamidase
MEKVVWLSHPLSVDTPAYGGGEGIRVEKMTEISSGDGANTARYLLPNHLGTHVDAPRHFFDNGITLTDYPPEYWVFDYPTLVNVQVKDGYLISQHDVKAALTNKTDLLLVRTGFEAYRDTSRYWQHNPGLSPELCSWLRIQYPQIRAIGMDLISVTSRHHRQKGREAHRALLDPAESGTPMLPVEDMMLGHLDLPLKRVVISPLQLDHADGGPCTVLGFC